MIQKKDPRILIVKLGALGDLFFALPALAEIKRKYPFSQIDWVVSDSLSSVLINNPMIHKVISVETQKLYKGSFFQKLLTALHLRRQISNTYDLIFIFHRSKGYLLPFLGKAPIFMMGRYQKKTDQIKANLFFEKKRIPLSQRLLKIFFKVEIIPFEILKTHESLQIAETLNRGLLNPAIHQGLWLSDSKEYTSYLAQPLPSTNEGILTKKGQRIGIHLGGGQNNVQEFTLKQWPYFAELIQLIINNTSLEIVLLGSSAEVSSTEVLLKKVVSEPTRIQNQVGKTNLPSLVQVISACDFFIGVDSGPLHIADYFQIPSLGLYGPTSPASWGLLNTNSKCLFYKTKCQPCYLDDGHFPCCYNDHQCMTLLTAESVFTEFKKIFDCHMKIPMPKKDG